MITKLRHIQIIKTIHLFFGKLCDVISLHDSILSQDYRNYIQQNDVLEFNVFLTKNKILSCLQFSYKYLHLNHTLN